MNHDSPRKKLRAKRNYTSKSKELSKSCSEMSRHDTSLKRKLESPPGETKRKKLSVSLDETCSSSSSLGSKKNLANARLNMYRKRLSERKGQVVKAHDPSLLDTCPINSQKKGADSCTKETTTWKKGISSWKNDLTQGKNGK